MYIAFFFQSISPLFSVACAITAGICAQYFFQLPINIIHSAIFCSLFFLKNANKKSIPIYINNYFLLTVFLLSLCFIHYQKINHDLMHTKLTNKTISLSGKVKDIQLHNHAKFPYYIRLKTIAYKEKSSWEPITSTVILYTTKITNINIDDVIEITNIRSNKSSGTFKNFLIYNNIGAYFFCPYMRYKITNASTWSVNKITHKITNNILTCLEKKLSPNTFCLFATLFLGKKMKYINPKSSLPDQFKQWGVSHLLARSGAHLALFMSIYFFIMRYIPITLIIKQCLSILFCIIYFLLSFSSISFLRALTTILLFFCCTIIKRPSQLLHITLVTYILFLCINPISLFFLDFQLSFLFTISLSWLINQIYTKK